MSRVSPATGQKSKSVKNRQTKNGRAKQISKKISETKNKQTKKQAGKERGKTGKYKSN